MRVCVRVSVRECVRESVRECVRESVYDACCQHRTNVAFFKFAPQSLEATNISIFHIIGLLCPTNNAFCV